MRATWDDLPPDVVRVIWSWRRRGVLGRAATRVQSAWRRYRTLVLMGRFRTLRHLADFRAWNPSVRTFLRRARL